MCHWFSLLRQQLDLLFASPTMIFGMSLSGKPHCLRRAVAVVMALASISLANNAPRRRIIGEEAHTTDLLFLAGVKRQHELMRRQTTTIPTTFILTIAPDRTCGYLSGSIGNPIACPATATCVWESDQLGAIYCRDNQGGRFNLACLDRTDALDPIVCNDVCEGDIFTLRW
jgi:hypothetical protein